MDLNQFVPSQNSALTMDSAESTAAAAARAPNGAARAVDDYDDDDDAVPEVAACISAMLDLGGSVESKRLFLARRTALEMLRDRGYAVPEDELARTLPEFRAWWEDKPELERLAFSTTLASDPSSKVWFFPLLSSYLPPWYHTIIIGVASDVLALGLELDSCSSARFQPAFGSCSIRSGFVLLIKELPKIDSCYSLVY
jgi:hypothetical protein